MTGLPGSETTVPALASSANPRTLGAAARAPTVAAPIAAPCRNFRRDILFLGSRAIRFPSVYGTAHPDHPILQREARQSRGYFVMCNSPCYNESIPDSAATSFSEGMTNSGADAANLGKPSYPCFHHIGRILGGFGVCIELGSWLSRYSEDRKSVV